MGLEALEILDGFKICLIKSVILTSSSMIPQVSLSDLPALFRIEA